MVSQIKDTAWLEWMASLTGAASRQRPTAMLAPEKFHCLLDELPLHLIPQYAWSRGTSGDENFEPLTINSECFVTRNGEIPDEFRGHENLLQGFDLQSTIAWVRDPACDSLHPFWLGRRLEPIVLRLRAGEILPESLPIETRRILARAGILTPANNGEVRRPKWSEVVKKGIQVFRERNYFPVRDLIHPLHIAAMRRYYRRAIRTGAISLGDTQSARRYIVHNEPVARFFHHQMASAVSAIVGEPVKPSYVYLGSYLAGAELKKHTDREQCEFSVTLCLDFSPEPEAATSWPIRLGTPEGTVTVYQALGDGLVYRGTKVPHYRDVLAPGYTSTSIFFHYVPADFSGPLD
jgi:hypothetical protein